MGLYHIDFMSRYSSVLGFILTSIIRIFFSPWFYSYKYNQYIVSQVDKFKPQWRHPYTCVKYQIKIIFCTSLKFHLLMVHFLEGC
jgi:hypothetical protein